MKRLVAAAALITCLLLAGCTRDIPNASYEDGYYWYRADGVSIIKAKTHAREPLSAACSSRQVTSHQQVICSFLVKL